MGGASGPRYLAARGHIANQLGTTKRHGRYDVGALRVDIVF